MSDPIRVLIADDHTLFREGLTAIIDDAADIDVVGEVADGQEAIRQATRLKPDVILMDIVMPGLNGIEATKRILGTSPDVGIIALTMLEDDDSVFAAMLAGARGYILKGAEKSEVLQSIRILAGGGAFFGPAIATRLTRFFNRIAPTLHKENQDQTFPELTKREREVLEMIARGCGNVEIADRLLISQKTVSNHISNIYSKLQVAGRAQAIIMAKDAGMGEA